MIKKVSVTNVEGRVVRVEPIKWSLGNNGYVKNRNASIKSFKRITKKFVLEEDYTRQALEVTENRRKKYVHTDSLCLLTVPSAVVALRDSCNQVW
jgi:hypothetical protein